MVAGSISLLLTLIVGIPVFMTLDASPSELIQIGHLNKGGETWDVEADIAYVLDQNDGLGLIDVIPSPANFGTTMVHAKRKSARMCGRRYWS